MAWLRIDDRVRTHPKIVKAGPAAAWFWFCGICYCREHLTDGFIQEEMIATLAPGVRNGKALATTLIERGLWHEVNGGYRVHDFLDWNPSRQSVLDARAADLERKKKKNEPNSGTDSTVDSTVESTVDSTVDSNRILTGFQTTPSRDRAGAPARARDRDRDPDPDPESSDLRKQGDLPRARANSLIVSPLEWDRKHGAVHVTEFCDFVCFPKDLADSFARKLVGTPFEEAHAQVLMWARDVRQQWQGRVVPDGSDYDFWRHRWTETHGGSKPGPTDRSHSSELEAEHNRVLAETRARHADLEQRRSGRK